MALGTIAGAIASAGTSFALNKAFGGSSRSQQFPTLPEPGGIPSGVQSTLNRRGQLASELRSLGQQEAGQIRGLRDIVAPGVSRLREARLGRVSDALRKGVGDLRETLAQRRIAGSSFGVDALSRLRSEFARLESDVEAETGLQELQLTTDLIGKEFDAARSGITAELQATGIDAQILGGVAINADRVLSQNARFAQELAAKEAAGQGQFIGSITAPLVKSIGSGVSSLPLFGGRNRTGAV